MPASTTAHSIKVKTATVTTTAVEPPVVNLEPAVPLKPPLDAAMERLESTRRQTVLTATQIYREHVTALSNDVRLGTAQMEALAHSLVILSLKPDDVKADVNAIRTHRDQLVLAERMRTVVAELEPQQAGWLAEEAAAQKRRNELAGERYRLQQSGIAAAQHTEAANRITVEHVRVFGSLTAAVEKVLAPPPGPYQPKTIRNELVVVDAQEVTTGAG